MGRLANFLLMATKEYENRAAQKGFTRIAGVDEAGRGPLAGPVVACAVILPLDFDDSRLTDSKLLTPDRRKALYRELICHPAIEFGVGVVSHEVIDRINILQATFEAFTLALYHLKKAPDYVLYDGNRSPKTQWPSETIVGGDLKCQSISAASIIAKVVRDEMMEEFDRRWPEYGFGAHKGYATKAHLEALQTYGPCPIHRHSFSPLSELLQHRVSHSAQIASANKEPCCGLHPFDMKKQD